MATLSIKKYKDSDARTQTITWDDYFKQLLHLSAASRGVTGEKNTLPTVIKQLVIISRGIQTQPIRNRKVVKKTTTYQENDKNIEVGEMKETECIDIR